MQSQTQSAQTLFSRLASRQHFQDLLTACSVSRDQYLAQYISVAERLAFCVQDLPLSPDVFSAPGGALQAGLQSGLLAVRSCDATIFQPKATAQERQRNDPQYRWCAYCATLATIYLICAGQIEVVLSGGEVFSFASAKPLGGYDGSYTARWHQSAAQPSQAGLIYLQAFFFPGQFAHLPQETLAMMAGAINPLLTTNNAETPLGRVVRTSVAQVLEAQRKRDAAVIMQTAPAEMVDVPVESVAPSGARPVDPLKPSSTYQAADPSPAPSSVPAAAPATAPATSSSSASPKTNQSPAENPAVGISPKVLEWVRALAHIRAMDAEITVDEQGIQFSRKALGFGATPKDNYTALYEAKVVLDKGEGHARCNHLLAKVYAEEKAKALGGAT